MCTAMQTDTLAETPEQLRALVALKDEQIAQRDIEIRLLREMLALARQNRFGPKSEKTPPEQQAGLFNEAEATADPKVQEPEPEKEEITYTRRSARQCHHPAAIAVTPDRLLT